DSGQLMQRGEIESARAWDRIEAVEFFAISPERAQDGLVAIYEDATHRLTFEPQAGRAPQFLALPAQASTAHGIGGQWVWHITTQDGDEIEFEVGLSEHDGIVQVTGPEKQDKGDGKFSADHLS